MRIANLAVSITVIVMAVSLFFIIILCHYIMCNIQISFPVYFLCLLKLPQTLKFVSALTNPQIWVLSFYAACGSLLICCMETQLSFIRTPMALNFGFLSNPALRFLYYILLATICLSLGNVFAYICAGVLVGIALCNTYILMRYPAYRKLRDQLAKEEDARIEAAMRDKVRKEAVSAMFSRK